MPRVRRRVLRRVGGPKWDNGDVRPEVGIFKLRSSMKAFANLRPIRTYWSGSVSPLRPELVEGLDLLIVRELTGGLYFGERGHDETAPSTPSATSVEEINRILRQGFRLAQSPSRSPDERRQGERARHVASLAPSSPTRCRPSSRTCGSTTSSSTP